MEPGSFCGLFLIQTYLFIRPVFIPQFDRSILDIQHKELCLTWQIYIWLYFESDNLQDESITSGHQIFLEKLWLSLKFSFVAISSQVSFRQQLSSFSLENIEAIVHLRLNHYPVIHQLGSSFLARWWWAEITRFIMNILLLSTKLALNIMASSTIPLRMPSTPVLMLYPKISGATPVVPTQ